MPIRRCKETRLDWNSIGHRRLVYADTVNLVGENISVIKESRHALTDANKEAGFDLNTQKNLHRHAS
jgi:hypothetical protein